VSAAVEPYGGRECFEADGAPCLMALLGDRLDYGRRPHAWGQPRWSRSFRNRLASALAGWGLMMVVFIEAAVALPRLPAQRHDLSALPLRGHRTITRGPLASERRRLTMIPRVSPLTDRNRRNPAFTQHGTFLTMSCSLVLLQDRRPLLESTKWNLSRRARHTKPTSLSPDNLPHREGIQKSQVRLRLANPFLRRYACGWCAVTSASKSRTLTSSVVSTGRPFRAQYSIPPTISRTGYPSSANASAAKALPLQPGPQE
jgi:hypothetical protein